MKDAASSFPLNAWYAAAYDVEVGRSLLPLSLGRLEGDDVVCGYHDPAWAADGKLITVKCDYRLVIDNLMDLTHETYVHGSSIGTEAVVEAPCTVTIDVGVAKAASGALPDRPTIPIQVAA